MMSFLDKADANRALILARGSTEQCFIGRHRPTRPNVPESDKFEYTITYWRGSTNQKIDIPDEHCTAYAPSHLVATDRGAEGWTVSDGSGGFTLTVDNRDDAEALLALARQHTTHCTIGYRSPPGTHIIDRNERVNYWK